MHEMMVAQSLMAIISNEAAKHDAKPVVARISCGMLNSINDEALCFAFEAIAKDTLYEDLKFQIEHKPIRARCETCKVEFEIELSRPECPCGSEKFELLADAPLILEEIDFQTD
ncbi:MAG: hydrogenase maturation nickel metallochaperone HypA [Planctomycetes bacterium]|nr:hydrogenase maturation nickel metallochaperone HypA [Planctomycetota bacterium]MBL7185465.1 hydrogenase maturation nickel metallochaperone HypA [Phycisphaerae bacterium]